MGRGLYLHPGLNLLALHWMPRTHKSHERLVGTTPYEDPPIIRIHSNAGVMHPTAPNGPIIEDRNHRFETCSVLLAQLYVQPCRGIPRHSTVCVEVTPHVGQTVRCSNELKRIKVQGQELCSRLEHPQTPCLTLPVHPAAVSKHGQRRTNESEPICIRLGESVSSVSRAPSCISKCALEIGFQAFCANSQELGV